MISVYNTLRKYTSALATSEFSHTFKKYKYCQFTTIVAAKFGDPKNDVLFKKLFGSDKTKDLLIDFINKILPDKHVHDIEYMSTHLEPEISFKKQSVLDILCFDEDGSKYILEMQNAKDNDFDKRAVYYASKTYATQLDKGGKYSDLKEKAYEVLEMSNWSDKELLAYQACEKIMRDNESREYQVREEGREQGREQGREEAKIDIVKKLLSQNIDINIISTATDLSVLEINELKF
eukprot:gene10032-20893_t